MYKLTIDKHEKNIYFKKINQILLISFSLLGISVISSGRGCGADSVKGGGGGDPGGIGGGVYVYQSVVSAPCVSGHQLVCHQKVRVRDLSPTWGTVYRKSEEAAAAPSRVRY